MDLSNMLFGLRADAGRLSEAVEAVSNGSNSGRTPPEVFVFAASGSSDQRLLRPAAFKKESWHKLMAFRAFLAIVQRLLIVLAGILSVSFTFIDLCEGEVCCRIRRILF